MSGGIRYKPRDWEPWCKSLHPFRSGTVHTFAVTAFRSIPGVTNTITPAMDKHSPSPPTGSIAAAGHRGSIAHKVRQRGVVLLDVIAALAIFALAAYILMPRPHSRIGAAELSGEAVRVSGEFRKARVQAITTRDVADVMVDPGTRRI